MSFFMLELADGFQKRLAFNVAHRSSYFNNGNLRILGSRVPVEAILDLIGDVGDYLDGTAAKVSPAFLLKDGPIDLAGGHVRVLAQALVYKSFIVPEVKIGLCSIIGYKHFAVLHRVHGTGIHVDIRIELLHGHRISAGL